MGALPQPGAPYLSQGPHLSLETLPQPAGCLPQPGAPYLSQGTHSLARGLPSAPQPGAPFAPQLGGGGCTAQPGGPHMHLSWGPPCTPQLWTLCAPLSQGPPAHLSLGASVHLSQRPPCAPQPGPPPAYVVPATPRTLRLWRSRWRNVLLNIYVCVNYHFAMSLSNV